MIYEIRVRGILNDQWADWFGDLTLVPQANQETVLIGPIVDQSALHGILDVIQALNLTLISICPVAGPRTREGSHREDPND
jgi:hypothetical protein